MAPRICPICGNPFEPSHHAKKTCSEPCRKTFNSIRDKNYRRALYRNDPDINRRKYQRLLESAAAVGRLDDVTEQLREQRKRAAEKRDADPIRRAEYLRREQIRNAFRGEYLDQKKITWRTSLSDDERQRWRIYNTQWARERRKRA